MAISSPYAEREQVRGNESVKQPCRERILEFILSNHRGDNGQLLSLPGTYWSFENQLLSQLPGMKFLAFERDAAVLNQGLYSIPGRNLRRIQEEVANKAIWGFRTHIARIFNANASEILCCGRTSKAGGAERRRWAREYKSCSCIWLDYNSQLCSEVIRCLNRLDSYAHMKIENVPMAVTVQVGRESPNVSRHLKPVSESVTTEERRQHLIEIMMSARRFRDFSYRGSFVYQGVGSTKMLTVLGILTRQ